MDEERSKRRANEFIDVEAALSHVYPPAQTSYDEKDLILYALGVGAGSDPRDLRFAYEGHPRFAALPTFALVPALNVALSGGRAPGLNYGLERVLHTAQRLELRRPLPRAAKLRHQPKVVALYDRTKVAVVVTEVRTFDEAGEELARCESTLTVRGAGRFGGEPGPVEVPDAPPQRPPDAVVEEPTRLDQALLYRLSGDRNPLHADPAAAQDLGLPGPILHGVCTLGFAVRHVLRAAGGDEAENVKAVRVRFAAPVYPGETLTTEIWREGPTRLLFQTRVARQERLVLANAALELFAPAPEAAAPQAAPVPGAPAPGAQAPGAQAAARLEEKLKAARAERVGAVVQLRVQDPASDWVLDLKSGPVAVRAGIAADADLTLQLSDAALADWASGAALRELLSQSKVRLVAGDARVAQRLAAALAANP